MLSADESLKLTIAEEDGRGMIQDFLRDTAQKLGLFIIGGTIPCAHQMAAFIPPARFIRTKASGWRDMTKYICFALPESRGLLTKRKPSSPVKRQ